MDGPAAAVAVMQGVVAVPVQSARQQFGAIAGAIGKLSDELKNSARLMFD